MNNFLTTCARYVVNFAVHLLGYDTHIVRWLRKKLRFSKKEAKGILRHFIRQHILLALSYTILPWVMFVFGLILMGILDSACANTPLEWSAWIDTLPTEIQPLVGILVFLGPPVALGTVIYRRQRRKMRNHIQCSLTTPLCIHCGFDLSDREHTGDTAFCTDCGNTTPMVKEE